MSKVFIEDTTLTAIGDAIREKTGGTDLLTLDQMPAEIASIEISGGGTETESIVLSGDCQYFGTGPLSSKFIELFGNKITTNKIIIKTKSINNTPSNLLIISRIVNIS